MIKVALLVLVALTAAGAVAEPLEYWTAGGAPGVLAVYRPAATVTGAAPAILLIHGGGWAGGTPGMLAPHAEHFASNGWAAITVGYRLVSPTNAVRIADCLDDCRAALQFVREQAGRLGIDAGRLVVAGESAGGQLAAMLAAEDSALAGVILYNPVLDLPALKWIAGHRGVAAGADTPAGETWRERAERLSPIRFVRAGWPPTLVIHGAKDGVVPVEQADRFVEAMRAAGNRIEYERPADWGHAFLIPNHGTPQQMVTALDITDRFLARSIKPAQ